MQPVQFALCLVLVLALKEPIKIFTSIITCILLQQTRNHYTYLEFWFSIFLPYDLE